MRCALEVHLCGLRPTTFHNVWLPRSAATSRPLAVTLAARGAPRCPHAEIRSTSGQSLRRATSGPPCCRQRRPGRAAGAGARCRGRRAAQACCPLPPPLVPDAVVSHIGAAPMRKAMRYPRSALAGKAHRPSPFGPPSDRSSMPPRTARKQDNSCSSESFRSRLHPQVGTAEPLAGSNDWCTNQSPKCASSEPVRLGDTSTREQPSRAICKLQVLSRGPPPNETHERCAGGANARSNGSQRTRATSA